MYKRCVLCKYNNVPLCFFDEIGDALADLGYEVIILDLTEANGSINLSEIVDRGIDFFLSFNEIQVNAPIGLPLYDYLGVPHIVFFVDTPVNFAQSVLTYAINANVFFTCADRNHVVKLRRMFGKSSVFLPNAGSMAKNPKKMADRHLDCLFSGDYLDYEEIVSRTLTTPFVADLFLKMIDEFTKHPAMSLLDAWDICTDAEPKDYVSLLELVDTVRKLLGRTLVLETLLSAGVEITCCGNGWEKSPFIKYEKFIHKAGLDFSDVVEQMGNSKIVLNSMPTFKQGVAEKFFSAMLSGAVCLTDENEYLKEVFTDGEELVYYNPSKINELPERVIDLLNNHDKLEYISANAYKKTIDRHTWKNRAADLINYVNSLYETGRAKFVPRASKDQEFLTTKVLDILITEKCSLRCEHCATLMQYFEQPQNMPLAQVFRDIDLTFSAFDWIIQFNIFGGEALLHGQLAEILDYTAQYKSKFGSLRTATNGTIIPNEETLKSMKRNNLFVDISDYGEVSRNIDALCKKLTAYGINWNRGKIWWRDIQQLVDGSGRDEKVAFSNCQNICYMLKNGLLYRCPFLLHAETLQAIPHSEYNSINLANPETTKADIFAYLRTPKNFQGVIPPGCAYCSGYNMANARSVPTAQQIKAPLVYKKFS